MTVACRGWTCAGKGATQGVFVPNMSPARWPGEAWALHARHVECPQFVETPFGEAAATFHPRHVCRA